MYKSSSRNYEVHVNKITPWGDEWCAILLNKWTRKFVAFRYIPVNEPIKITGKWLMFTEPMNYNACRLILRHDCDNLCAVISGQEMEVV